MTPIIAIAAAIAAAIAGFVLGSSRAAKSAQGQLQDYVAEAETQGQAEAERLTREAQAQAKRLVSDAKRQANQAREEAKEENDKLARTRQSELDKASHRLTKREDKLDERASELDRSLAEVSKREATTHERNADLVAREEALAAERGSLHTALEKIAELSRDDARAQVMESVVEEARLEAARSAREIEEAALEEADRRAKKVLAVTIQRYAGEFVTERCVSVVSLASDDMKGRIIGREGRNIRAIEAATGVDFIIDDTPDTMVISCFDPVRREIARQAVERLMADGRIHPSRIEEVVNKTKKEMARTVKANGEEAALELGLTGLHPEIVSMMGRLKYRTSYGQNMWAHSIEAGYLCGLMAGELGLNVKLARRAGFLHDIGKAMDQSAEGGHAIVGANFIKKYGEDDLIVNAVAAHHEEVKPASVIAHLVMAADALSGARPGARREVASSYVQRLEDLERISTSYKGVERCYAVQAGREIRVIVEHHNVNDDQAAMLSRDIARQIEQELTYPGQIKVTVIRETRASEIAR